MSSSSTVLMVDGQDVILSGIANDDLLIRSGSTITGVAVDSFQESFEKGQPNGYAPLDASAIVPLANLPAFQLVSEKGQPNGYPSLGPDGKIPVSEIPPLVIHDVFIVNNYVDLATLTTAQTGDVGIVTSDAQPQLRGTYILTQEPSSLLANWYRVSSSTLVATVNGIPGPTVVLSASNLTTGTLPVAQLPVLQATGDATGTGSSGTGSIPLTLQPTGVTPGFYSRPILNIDAKGRILSAMTGADILYYQAFYFDQTWTTPSNIPTNFAGRFPIDGVVFPLISQGNLGSVLAPSSTSFYDIRYTGATKTFKITVKGVYRFDPAGVTNSTQFIWNIYADRPLPLTSVNLPGSRQLIAVSTPSAGKNTYTLNMQCVCELNNTATVSVAYFYAPNGAGTNTMVVDEMYMLFEQMD
jgi:hypothetical protein